MAKVNTTRKGRNGRKPLSAADRAHIDQLFSLIERHADCEDGEMLMSVVEPHYKPTNASVGNDGVDNGAGNGVVNGRMNRMTVDEVVREIADGIAELPPERVMEVKRVYWQGQSNLIARDCVQEQERKDALINAKATNAYAEMFAARNKR